MPTETFLYFAYGSNLLKKRIKINNPTAEFVGIGKLDIDSPCHSVKMQLSNGERIFEIGPATSEISWNRQKLINDILKHQLDFIKYSDHWRGSSATIIPIDGYHIWGAIWRLHNKDMASLDWQEGVDSNWYFAKTVEVVTPEDEKLQCRTYQQTINPPVRSPNEELPSERRPSSTYLDCILKGAIECNLPKEYIEDLKKIPHNGQKASPKMIEKLNM